MKDVRVEFLKEKNVNKAVELIREKGKYKILSEYAFFLDKRTYFKVDEYGNVNKKTYNPLPLIFYFCDDEKILAESLFKYADVKEKQNIKKIDRTSNLDIATLKKNLMKTLVNMNLDFSKIFAKELFSRDRKSFFEVLYNFSLMGNPNDLKLFFVYVLENIFNKIEYDENIFYIFIAYLTKQRDNFEIYLETKDIEKIDLNRLKSFFAEKDKYMEIFLDVTSRYKFENIKKFRSVLLQYFKKEFDFNEDLKNVLKISGE